MVAPLVKRKIVKKRTKKFKRPQSDRILHVPVRWPGFPDAYRACPNFAGQRRGRGLRAAGLVQGWGWGPWRTLPGGPRLGRGAAEGGCPAARQPHAHGQQAGLAMHVHRAVAAAPCTNLRRPRAHMRGERCCWVWGGREVRLAGIGPRVGIRVARRVKNPEVDDIVERFDLG